MAREMKDSGIEWIGEIPVDWNIKRNKLLFVEVNNRCESGNEHMLLSVSEYYGVAPKSEKVSDGEFETRAESLDGYKLCEAGDIIMNIMLAWKRSTGRSAYAGIVSPAYCVYRKKADIDTRYYHYLFRTDIVAELFKRYSTGIIDSRLRLYPDKFMGLNMIVPSCDEQCQIAEYLDKQCVYIDSVIEKTKVSVDEYIKLKQAIITQAVTKGVRGDRKMKDCGIECIGEIPLTWNQCKLKNVSVRIGDGLHGTPEFDDNGNVYFINGNNIGEKYVEIRSDTKRLSIDELMKYSAPILNDNTIMIALNGATYGKVSLYKEYPVLLGKSAGYITLFETVCREYMRYYLMSSTSKIVMALSLNGTTIPNLSLATLNNFPTLLPPIEEQREIAQYLDSKVGEVDALIIKKEQYLLELESFKKSLIYEYVTGKKEVPQY